MTAAEFIAQKVATPSAMLSRDWERVSAAARERAFFMAGVVRAELLDAFRGPLEDFAAGRLGRARAREEIRVRLQRLGYAPEPGTEGSIKDLSSFARINTVLDTNVRLAAGWAGHTEQLQATKAFPAKQLKRLTPRREPRNWPARARVAAARVDPAGVNAPAIAAHVTSAFWVELSDFKTPYPLYAYGSGMGDKILDRDEAEALGVATMPPPPSPDYVPAEIPGLGMISPAMNATLEITPAVKSAAVRESLTREMNGTAKWEGKKLVYLDPNGTRPAPAEELKDIVRAAPFPGAPRYQMDAAAQYAAEGPESFRPGSDALYDLARLVRRTRPLTEQVPLWAVRAFTNAADVARFVAALETGLPALPGWPFLTLDPSPDVALRDVPEGAVVLTVNKHATARDLRPLLGTLPGGADVPGVLMEAGRRFRILRRQETGGVLHLICEEIF